MTDDRRPAVIFGAGPVGRAIARQLLAAGRPCASSPAAARASRGPSITGRPAMDAARPRGLRGRRPRLPLRRPGLSPLGGRISRPCRTASCAAPRGRGALVVVENLYGYGVAGTLTEGAAADRHHPQGPRSAPDDRAPVRRPRGGPLQAVAGRAADFFGPGVRQSVFGDAASGPPCWRARGALARRPRRAAQRRPTCPISPAR